MSIDRYTKVILTIIAFCLVLLVLKSYRIVPDAHADSPTPVYIEGCSTTAFYMAEPIEIKGEISGTVYTISLD